MNKITRKLKEYKAKSCIDMMAHCIKKQKYYASQFDKYKNMAIELTEELVGIKCKSCGNEYYADQVNMERTAKTQRWYCPNCKHLNVKKIKN